MATLTVTLDPELVEAAKLEADRRNISVDEMFSEFLKNFADKPKEPRDYSNLIRLMREGVLGDLGKLPTRDEIYEERLRWPRS